MKRRTFLAALPAGLAAAEEKVQLEWSGKIWDQAPHNAFTDLIRFRGRLYCSFREGKAHVSPDGAIRVLVSRDGEKWEPAARIESKIGDLRDPKLCLAPKNTLMMTTAAALPAGAEARHVNLAWFSKDGQNWGEPERVGPVDKWLWRVTWFDKEAWSMGYSTTGGENRLYRSQDGHKWEDEGPAPTECFANETTIRFAWDGAWCALVRRDACEKKALLWLRDHSEQRELSCQIGGPNFLVLKDRRLLGAGRLYDGGARTSLFWIDAETGKVDEILKLPSGGDTSYPGMVLEGRRLWMSYYSSHEGKTSIYLARLKVG